MIRRNFLSTLAGWLSSTTLLSRWRSKPVEAPTPDPGTEPLSPVISPPRVFDEELWRTHLQARICKQMPEVTFGSVAKIPLDDDGQDHYFKTMEDYCGKNGYFFIFDVPYLWDIQVEAEREMLDETIDAHLAPIIHYLDRRISSFTPAFVSCSITAKFATPTPRRTLVCEIKHLESIRQYRTFADAVRGIIFADVIDIVSEPKT